MSDKFVKSFADFVFFRIQMITLIDLILLSVNR
ncbi:hypothetical protein ABIE50_006465 [Chitinophaga sp. OAE865]